MPDYRTIMIRNGNSYVPYRIYTCDRCGKDIEEAHPMYEYPFGVLCGSCAFISGVIGEEEYFEKFAFWYGLRGRRAVVRDGKIYIGVGKFPWERTSRDRECVEYKKWRKSVYERDEYTCQNCGKTGGKLNAHHIKPYKDFPEFRYDIDNGITLCEKCHRELHKKKRGDSIGKLHKD